jgi:serine/threonine protein kinase
MTEAVTRLQAALAERYRIERELGQGGMATVYLAHDLRHDRKVAIKVLRPDLAAVIGAERFLREIKTIANLQHPHILGLIDSGEVGGTAYYVMPFVEGESLRDRLRRKKQLPIGEAARLATEIASALGYAHRHGVIHRDIKPENVLLHDGAALVADFGIALAVSTAGGTLAWGSLSGQGRITLARRGMPADSGAPRSPVDSGGGPLLDVIFPTFSTDGREILFARRDASGSAGIWAVPWPGGGRPSLVLRYDDPVREPYKPYWTMSRDRMFVLLQESESDVWIVEARGM